MVRILLLVAVCLSSACSFVPEHDYSPVLLSIYPDWHRKCKMYTGTTEELIQQTKEGDFPDVDSIKVDADKVVNIKKLKYLVPKGMENIADVVKKCDDDLLKTSIFFLLIDYGGRRSLKRSKRSYKNHT